MLHFMKLLIPQAANLPRNSSRSFSPSPRRSSLVVNNPQNINNNTNNIDSPLIQNEQKERTEKQQEKQKEKVEKQIEKQQQAEVQSDDYSLGGKIELLTFVLTILVNLTGIGKFLITYL